MTVRTLTIPQGSCWSPGLGALLSVIPVPAVPGLPEGHAHFCLCSRVHLGPTMSPCLHPCPLWHVSSCHFCKGGPAPAAPDQNPAGAAVHQWEALCQISVFQQVSLYWLHLVDLQRQWCFPRCHREQRDSHYCILCEMFVLLHHSRWKASRCAVVENPEVSEKIKCADSITRTTEFINVGVQSE